MLCSGEDRVSSRIGVVGARPFPTSGIMGAIFEVRVWKGVSGEDALASAEWGGGVCLLVNLASLLGRFLGRAPAGRDSRVGGYDRVWSVKFIGAVQVWDRLLHPYAEVWVCLDGHSAHPALEGPCGGRRRGGSSAVGL